MIDKFGQVMIYVNNLEVVAKFWVDKIGFIEGERMEYGEELAIEIIPYHNSDTSMVLFDKEVVKRTSPEVNLGTPSLLFSSYELEEFHKQLLEKGVTVSEVMEIAGMVTFNFSDPEGNYFAVKKISK